MRGAVVSGQQVVADVGGDLTLQSLQDTSPFDAKQKDMGGSVTVGAGFAASASYSYSKAKGDYASRTCQLGHRRLDWLLPISGVEHENAR